MVHGRIGAQDRNIGYARSTDGLHWTKSPRNPVIWGARAPKAYDASVGPPAVLKTDEGYKVWFTAIPGNYADHWQIGYAEYPLDAWSWTEGEQPAASMYPSYKAADLWAMSDAERMKALIPKTSQQTRESNCVIINGVPYTCDAYSLAGEKGWTWVVEVAGMAPSPARDAQLRAYQKYFRPGPGLSIFYRPLNGDRTTPALVFGTMTITLPLPQRLGGGARTLTVTDDGYRAVFNKDDTPLRLEGLHLNPNQP